MLAGILVSRMSCFPSFSKTVFVIYPLKISMMNSEAFFDVWNDDMVKYLQTYLLVAPVLLSKTQTEGFFFLSLFG